MDKHRMKQFGEHQPGLSGSLLVAHPGLIDPNFKHTVVLISVHSEDDGAVGVVLNRPLEKRLGEHQGDFAYGALSAVPLYYGGPVEQDKMILTAWKWAQEGGVFKLYFAITPEKAEEMLRDDPEVEIRGFLGYSGWGRGQLEGELKQSAWVVSPIDGDAVQATDGVQLWKGILSKVSPELKFLADEPDDLTMN